MIEVGTKCVVEVVVSLSLLRFSLHLFGGDCLSSLPNESQTRGQNTFLVSSILGVACDGLLKAAGSLCMNCKPGLDGLLIMAFRSRV
jgi:hypothetical protein